MKQFIHQRQNKPIMRCHIDIQPRQVQPRSAINGDGAEKRAEVLDAAADRAQEQNVAQDAGKVGEEAEGPAERHAVGEKGEEEEEEPSNDVDGNGQILCFQSAKAHSDDYRR